MAVAADPGHISVWLLRSLGLGYCDAGGLLSTPHNRASATIESQIGSSVVRAPPFQVASRPSRWNITGPSEVQAPLRILTTFFWHLVKCVGATESFRTFSHTPTDSLSKSLEHGRMLPLTMATLRSGSWIPTGKILTLRLMSLRMQRTVLRSLPSNQWREGVLFTKLFAHGTSVTRISTSCWLLNITSSQAVHSDPCDRIHQRPADAHLHTSGRTSVLLCI
ncbi:hypothetical protein QBC41DRAFT_8181 [Cercophora samala]|uniref:Uncharacterized protein n=1 Tax=Cercophora samala TaxID=330535 RepID=A0AA40D8N7_9PEZI|nr:hypothetical protein QBC41DRAFT_8181 [Cercophora samala]